MLKVTVPSSAVSTIKSGVICCRFMPSVSPSAAPGLGFSFSSSAITCCTVSSVMPSVSAILSHRLFMKSSKHLFITAVISSFSTDVFLRAICSSRHSFSDSAPMPGGSKVCNIFTTLAICSSVVNMLRYKANSSHSVSMSLRSSPSASSDPMTYSMMSFSWSVSSTSSICSFSLS